MRRLASVLAATVVALAAVPQVASAAATRTITGTTVCADGIAPVITQVDYGSGWTTSGGSSYTIPYTGKTVFTWTIPTNATGFALDAFCYYDLDEYYGYTSYPAGTWEGYTYSLMPDTGDITSLWQCFRGPVAPGPWVRTCTLESIAYG